MITKVEFGIIELLESEYFEDRSLAKVISSIHIPAKRILAISRHLSEKHQIPLKIIEAFVRKIVAKNNPE